MNDTLVILGTWLAVAVMGGLMLIGVVEVVSWVVG